MKKLSPSDAIWENWTKRLDDAVGIEKRLCQCREIIRRLAQTELNLSHNPKP